MRVSNGVLGLRAHYKLFAQHFTYQFSKQILWTIAHMKLNSNFYYFKNPNASWFIKRLLVEFSDWLWAELGTSNPRAKKHTFTRFTQSCLSAWKNSHTATFGLVKEWLRWLQRSTIATSVKYGGTNRWSYVYNNYLISFFLVARYRLRVHVETVKQLRRTILSICIRDRRPIRRIV